jgi:hypothetical protein
MTQEELVQQFDAVEELFQTLLQSAEKSYNLRSVWRKTKQSENQSTQIITWGYADQSFKIEYTQIDNDHCTPCALKATVYKIIHGKNKLVEYSETFYPKSDQRYQMFYDLVNGLTKIASQTDKTRFVQNVIQSSERSSVVTSWCDDPQNYHQTKYLIWDDPETNYHYVVAKEYFDLNQDSAVPINHISVSITETACFLGLIKYQCQITFIRIIQDDLMEQLEQITSKNS